MKGYKVFGLAILYLCLFDTEGEGLETISWCKYQPQNRGGLAHKKWDEEGLRPEWIDLGHPLCPEL